ncbi:hypothetical protein C8Q72DRAFT_885517 [Fomitopsis betulina]|nr:hypothetical protein C8Q72DRAFT_885517 [Fomitopsis betulina]
MKKPVLVSKNYIFVNHCFRDPVLGDLYVKVTGVKELLNAAQANGILKGKYANDNILSGLLEAFMLKNDKEAHGVGMQNFKWLSGYHEFVTIIRFHSPSAYWSLAQYLPAPTERGYRLTSRLLLRSVAGR